MDELNKSIVDSLDGTDVELLPYLPYILQDLWEIGADPVTMVSLIREYIHKKELKILDLGCGKGAISVNIAKELTMKVKGIDAVPEFIEEAEKYALKYQVSHLCEFEVGDIRIKIKDLKGFDLVVLGAIGPVLGNLKTTLQTLKGCINSPGYVLLDDCYLADDTPAGYDRCLRKTKFYNQIESAGFQIVKEEIMTKDDIADSEDFILNSIEQRIHEMIKQYPPKERLFLNYLESQKFENYMLENELICGTWLLCRHT